MFRGAATAVVGACLVTGWLAACGDDEVASTTGAGGAGGTGEGVLLLGGEDCDPMVPTHCGYPFPSNVYLVDDDTTATGKRVQFGATSLPAHRVAGHLDPSWLSDHDGFSTGIAPMTHLPGATLSGLPSIDDIPLSLSKESPTVLLEAETGKAVPHFAELDMSSEDDGDRAFMIRPVVRLKDATRYIVAIRRVLDAAGEPLEPSDVFLALREGKNHPDPSVEARRDLYSDIFERLLSAGYAIGDLQIAWDFTTASEASNTRAMLHMRDEALASVGEKGPTYSIESVEDAPNEHIKQRVNAKMTVPLYLDKPEAGGRLNLGPDGLPLQNGTAEYDVVIHIPNSIDTGEPHGLLQNGHGLLGSRNEGRNGFLARIADEKKYVAFSVNLVGFEEDDEAVIGELLVQEPGRFRYIVERQHQGQLNQLLAMRMMKGRFVDDPLVQVNGKSIIDPSLAFYRGDSQGGIMGCSYMALSTDVTRGVLGEGGMPYNLLLNRAKPFDPFFVILKTQYDSMLDIQLLLGVVQMMWDRAEPNGYCHRLTDNPFPNTPSHNVLMHVAIGDQQVTPLGAHLMARTIGAKAVTPLNRFIWGIEQADAPFAGNALVEFRFPGVPENPPVNLPPDQPDDNDPHDWVRNLQASDDQTDAFFRQGIVTQPCDGLCNPE